MPTANHPIHPEVDLLDGRWYATEPHETWTWMRQNAPVYYDQKNDVWAVMRYEDILNIEKDPKTWSNWRSPRPHGNPLPMMISMDDPEHLRRRMLVNRGFTPQRVRDKEPEIRQICDEIIDRVCEQGSCDFVWDIAAPLPLILIGDMLGFPRESYDDLLRWSDDMIRGTTATDQVAQEKAMIAGIEFREYQLGVIADRRARESQKDEPSKDLISILCQAAQNGEKLDDESLIQETLLILIGGDETTRHVITGGMLALLEHPEEREKLMANRSGSGDLGGNEYVTRAIEELLRWVTPIKNMSRTAMATVELRGQTIQEGDQVMLMYPSANRDEEIYEDPFKFDIERDSNHLAFGFGTHFCLGASLARLELKVMFEQLMERLPDIELAKGAELPFRASNFIVGPESMPVTFTPTARTAPAKTTAKTTAKTASATKAES